MCGIAGIYQLDNTKVQIPRLKAFTDSMVHRGPDGAGYELLAGGELGLGQRRLSILDLSEAGKQPMSYADGRYWITFNGEIFNFLELRKELLQKGFQFKSDSDTEVILASYIAWGKDCLNKFNGMWAFALWDSHESELFLSRDRFGIKPLNYYWKHNKLFAFASETRAFKHLEGFQRNVDQNLMRANVSDVYALEGLGYTPFQDIFQLLPGHYISFKKDKPLIQRRWWHISDHDKQEVPKTLEEQAEKFYDIFRDACRLRLRSDVPVATALSGGLDSTSVYSTVYDILKTEKLGRVNADSQRAFSAIFPGLQQNEKEFAEQAANYTGGSIQFIETDVANLIANVEKETELSDFISNTPITAISAVYKGMRQNGIVISMDGHGVDEMMFGYRDMVYDLYYYYLKNNNKHGYNNAKRVLLNTYHRDDQPQLEKDLNAAIAKNTGLVPDLKRTVKSLLNRNDGPVQKLSYTPANLPETIGEPYNFASKELPERMLYHEFFEHCLPALLRNFDRAAMMNSVEIRMPFMDWRLVSYVFSLPTESKIGEGFTKLLLRKAMRDKIDEGLRKRTFKVGIGSPIEYWMNGLLKEWTIDTVKDKDIRSKLTSSLSKPWEAPLVNMAWKSINADLISA